MGRVSVPTTQGGGSWRAGIEGWNCLTSCVAGGRSVLASGVVLQLTPWPASGLFSLAAKSNTIEGPKWLPSVVGPRRSLSNDHAPSLDAGAKAHLELGR